MRNCADPTLLTLRDIKDSIIVIECKPCGRHGELDRKALVKQFGASMRLANLRRRLSLGCEKMHSEDGTDRCGTTFVCLRERKA